MRLGDLDELKSEFDIIANNSATNEWQTLPIKHIKQIIDKAPTVEHSQGKWIPVSERLPDQNGECLVSLDFGDVNIDAFVDGIFVCYLGNVIAWQPLPEPYKEGGAE